MTLVFVALIFSWLPASADFWISTSRYIGERSEADKKAAEMAEDASRRVARIHEANDTLRLLRKRCLAGGYMVPSVRASLQAAGALLAVEQDVELARLQGLALKSRTEGHVEWAPAGREPVTALCGIPGTMLLRLPGAPIFGVRGRWAGFRVDAADAYAPPRWRYAHPDVIPL